MKNEEERMYKEKAKKLEEEKKLFEEARNNMVNRMWSKIFLN